MSHNPYTNTPWQLKSHHVWYKVQMQRFQDGYEYALPWTYFAEHHNWTRRQVDHAVSKLVGAGMIKRRPEYVGRAIQLGPTRRILKLHCKEGCLDKKRVRVRKR